MTIGERITKKRKELGLSQEELGERLGVSRQAVYKWESDGGLPEVDNIVAICKMFDVSLDWLINGVEGETSGEPAPKERVIIKEVQKEKKGLLYALVAILVIVLVFGAIRLKNIEDRFVSLQNSIEWIRSDTQRSIAGISYNVQQTLDKYNNAILDKTIEIENVDYKNNTICFDVKLMPKTVTEGMQVKLEISSVDENGRELIDSVIAESTDGKTFAAKLECSLTDNISITCTLVRGDEREHVLLAGYDGLYGFSFEEYDIIWPFNFVLSRDKTAFCDKYCEIAKTGYAGDDIKGITKASTKSLAVLLYDENDVKICDYKKLDGAPKDYVTDSSNEEIYFERPMDTKLDPNKNYYEKLIITDEFGRILENSYIYY